MSHGWDDGSGGSQQHHPQQRHPQQHQQWHGHGYQPEPQRSSSGVVIALIALLAALVLVLLGAVAYLFLRPGGISGDAPGQAGVVASSSSSPPSTAAAPAPVTETAYTTAPEPETVTVTRPAPGSRSPLQTAGYPAGADSSGWVTDRQARCNAGDPSAMMGRTTRSAFSICINPDNGRYYYRGSAGGAGVEVDDPVVSGNSATVSNNDVVYAIDSAGMVIYEGGAVISDQPMIDFWVG